MAAPSRFDEVRFSLAEHLAGTHYQQLVARVIAEVKALPAECRQSGDDSVLADVWEEFKYQMQREESFSFDVYEATIKVICRGVIDELDDCRRGLLWLWSSGYWDWDGEDDPIPFGDPVDDAVAGELYSRVCSVACDEELAVDPD